MENASKALLIAAEVLIGILLLTLFSYLFTKMSEQTARIGEKAKLNRINQFNQEFLNYEGRGTKNDDEGNPINPLTIQDVATLINLANDNDNKYKFATKVSIILDGSNLAYNNGNNWLNDKMNTNKLYDLYKCKSVEIDVKSKLVNKVELIKI